jgi:Polyketide cyclase / dehydrase and lipid transport
MATIRAAVTIEAPADEVWEVVAHQFHRVGDWATAIPTSTAITGVTARVDAPVIGRVCTTGVQMVPEVEERIVAYDEANRTLSYEGHGMPEFIKTARNRWHVQPLDDRRSRVSLVATLEHRGILGQFVYVFLRLQLTRVGPQFLSDLKYYIEHGAPSPRKERQLRAARR